jgi:hypothetical protein
VTPNRVSICRATGSNQQRASTNANVNALVAHSFQKFVQLVIPLVAVFNGYQPTRRCGRICHIIYHDRVENHDLISDI